MRDFAQIDVFTSAPFAGNPVAVVLDAAGLTTDAMQAVARWTNLSETTFVTSIDPDGADYEVRIFTPVGELPFAGHPTVGTCHALVDTGRLPRRRRYVQRCEAGDVQLTRDDDGAISFRSPPASITAADPDATALVADLAGAEVDDARLVDLGPRWMTARSTVPVLDLGPDLPAIARISAERGWTGLNLYSVGDDGVVEVRSLAPAVGVPEDPVCGSGNAAVAEHVRAVGSDLGPSWLARQGRASGRDGHLAVRIDDDGVHVGGRAVTVVRGLIRDEASH